MMRPVSLKVGAGDFTFAAGYELLDSWCTPPAITDTSGNHISGPLHPENDRCKAKLIAHPRA
jgi:hypothetical protein